MSFDYELPKISSVYPEKLEEKRQKMLYIRGSGFIQGGAPPISAYIGSVPIATIYYDSETQIRVELPALAVGDYELRIQNGTNGRVSNPFPLKIISYKAISQVENYIVKRVDQRNQPLPAPFNIRKDAQRIIPASQFTGTLPDVDVGEWGTPSGPTKGGYWSWSSAVVVSQFEFRSNGVEPAARSAGSGLYVRRRGVGSEILFLDLADTKEYFVRDSPI